MKKLLPASMLLLTACAPSYLDTLEYLTPVHLTKSQIAIIHAGVARSLKDPESARFGDVVAGKDPKGIVFACGYVNAKNSFGGYVGDKPFEGVLSTSSKQFEVVGIGGDDISTNVIFQACHKQGLYF